MKRKDVKNVMAYYNEIPEMIHALQHERGELEDQHYNALGAAAADGMPRSGEPGKPVENIAINAAEKGVGDRLKEITKRLEILDSDAEVIWGCLAGLNSRSNQVLARRYQHRDSWAEIALKMEAPDSTVRSWHDKALDVVGEALDEVPTSGEILGRASRARV